MLRVGVSPPNSKLKVSLGCCIYSRAHCQKLIMSPGGVMSLTGYHSREGCEPSLPFDFPPSVPHLPVRVGQGLSSEGIRSPGELDES